MQTISIACNFNGPAMPAGVALASVILEVTDSTGQQLPAITLNGTETPTPWKATATVADGAGNVNAQMLDTTGAVIGTPLDVPFDTGTAPAETNQLSALAIAVVPATPPASTQTPASSGSGSAGPSNSGADVVSAQGSTQAGA